MRTWRLARRNRWLVVELTHENQAVAFNADVLIVDELAPCSDLSGVLRDVDDESDCPQGAVLGLLVRKHDLPVSYFEESKLIDAEVSFRTREVQVFIDGMDCPKDRVVKRTSIAAVHTDNSP